jgi:hypothetical protein
MANNTELTEPIEYMLTTVDNPFDPFTRFDEWMEYDSAMGYHTLAFLDRLVLDSSELSEPDQALAIQEAIDEIARENVSGMHRKVTKDSAKEDRRIIGS